jgi:hypothetical protein
VQRDQEFLDPVQRCVLAGVDEGRPVVLGRDPRAGQLDLVRVGDEQGRDRGVEGQRQRGQLGGGEGTPPALGLVDGLTAPGASQVAPDRLTELGQRHPAAGPETGDLLANSHLDLHAAPSCHYP